MGKGKSIIPIVDKYDKKTEPGKVKILFDNIPNELKESNTWVCWKWKHDGVKWTKPPCTCSGAIFNHLQSDIKYKDAKKAYENNPDIAGIGFSLRTEDKYCGIDFDDCYKSNGKPNSRLKKALKLLKGAYVEVSPSGAGLRVFGVGKPKTRGSSKSSREIEIYKDGRYLTVTGQKINKSKRLINIEESCKKIDKKIYKRKDSKSKSKSKVNNLVEHENSDPQLKRIRELLYKIDQDGRDNWIHCGMIIKYLTGNSKDGFNTWLGWSQMTSAGNFSFDLCQSTWNSFKMKSAKEKPLGMGTLVRMAEGQKERKENILLTGSNIKVKRMEWKWKDWLPKNKLVIFAAEGGTGKSSTIYDLTARETTKNTFPFSQERGEGGKVLFITSEDDPEDTIIPRFKAAGGNPKKLLILNSEKLHLDLSEDGLEILEEIIENNKGITMIAIDPIDSYCGETNTHMASVVKGLMGPVNAFARKYSVCIIGILHFNKGDKKKGELKHMISGSASWVNSARLAIVAFEDPKSDEKYIGIVKSNNGDRNHYMKYLVQYSEKEDVVRIKYLESVDTGIQEKANEIFSAMPGSTDLEEKRVLILMDDYVTADGGLPVNSKNARNFIKKRMGVKISDPKLRDILKSNGYNTKKDGKHWFYCE